MIYFRKHELLQYKLILEISDGRKIYVKSNDDLTIIFNNTNRNTNIDLNGQIFTKRDTVGITFGDAWDLETLPDYFGYNMAVVEVIFPDDIKHLGNYCLSNCQDVTTIHLPNNLETIGDECFKQFYSLLGETRLPEGLTSIGSHFLESFGANPGGNGSLYIPDSVSQIGTNFLNSNGRMTELTMFTINILATTATARQGTMSYSAYMQTTRPDIPFCQEGLTIRGLNSTQQAAIRSNYPDMNGVASGNTYFWRTLKFA